VNAARDVRSQRIVFAANTMDDRLQFVRRIFNPSANVATRKLSSFTPQSESFAQDPADVVTANDNADCRLSNHAPHHRTTCFARRVSSG